MSEDKKITTLDDATIPELFGEVAPQLDSVGIKDDAERKTFFDMALEKIRADADAFFANNPGGINQDFAARWLFEGASAFHRGQVWDGTLNKKTFRQDAEEFLARQAAKNAQQQPPQNSAPDSAGQETAEPSKTSRLVQGAGAAAAAIAAGKVISDSMSTPEPTQDAQGNEVPAERSGFVSTTLKVVLGGVLALGAVSLAVHAAKGGNIKDSVAKAVDVVKDSNLKWTERLKQAGKGVMGFGGPS